MTVKLVIKKIRMDIKLKSPIVDTLFISAMVALRCSLRFVTSAWLLCNSSYCPFSCWQATGTVIPSHSEHRLKIPPQTSVF